VSRETRPRTEYERPLLLLLLLHGPVFAMRYRDFQYKRSLYGFTQITRTRVVFYERVMRIDRVRAIRRG